MEHISQNDPRNLEIADPALENKSAMDGAIIWIDQVINNGTNVHESDPYSIDYQNDHVSRYRPSKSSP
jgi:hypothetical protein